MDYFNLFNGIFHKCYEMSKSYISIDPFEFLVVILSRVLVILHQIITNQTFFLVFMWFRVWIFIHPLMWFLFLH